MILVSSDSSAPNSPVPGIGSKHTLDCTDKHCPNSDVRNDSTVDCYMPFNVRKRLEAEDNYHDSCETSSSLDINSKNTVDCAEIELSDSDAENDITVDYYSSVTFVKEMVSKNASQVSDVSASSTGVLQKIQKEVQLMDCEHSDDNSGGLDQREAKKGRYQLPSVGSVLTEDCPRKGRGRQRAKNAVIDTEKEIKRAERMQNRAKIKADQAQKKAVKMAATEAYRSKKPGECLKYMQVCLDQKLLNAEYGGEILVSLQSAEMQYNIQSNPVPSSVFWTREVQEHFVGDDMKVHVRSRKEEEEEMLIVWTWDEVITLIHTRELTNHIKSMQLMVPRKKLTLVVYGAREYFRHKKIFVGQEQQAQVLGTEGKLKNSKKRGNFERAPRVSKDEWESALAELHLFANCSHRLMEKPHELGAFIRQFSKAVAEAPFKHEKHKQEQENLQWYAVADSRDCVRVDKNGNGLLRLWQQQLCQFNRVTMETAQAITSVYRSPYALVQAYEKCSSEREAELMLEPILIRRGVGPLTTVKKVGPELSKKMYTFFTASDGKATLSQE